MTPPPPPDPSPAASPNPAPLSARWQELFWALPSGEMRSKLRALEHDVSRALMLMSIQPPPAASPGVDPWDTVRDTIRDAAGVARGYAVDGALEVLDDVLAAERQQHTAIATHLQAVGAACGFPIVNDHQQLAETICKAIHRRDAGLASLTQQLTEAQTQIATLRAAAKNLWQMSQCECRVDKAGERTYLCESCEVYESTLAASLTGDQP